MQISRGKVTLGQKSYLNFKINESLKVYFGRQAAENTENVNWKKVIRL